MLIQRLTLKKILSFNEATVELGPLNVLIGPNAVGKSNLIEVQAAPGSLEFVEESAIAGGYLLGWVGVNRRFLDAALGVRASRDQ